MAYFCALLPRYQSNSASFSRWDVKGVVAYWVLAMGWSLAWAVVCQLHYNGHFRWLIVSKQRSLLGPADNENANQEHENLGPGLAGFCWKVEKTVFRGKNRTGKNSFWRQKPILN